jgi:hypothetical protein
MAEYNILYKRDNKFAFSQTELIATAEESAKSQNIMIRPNFERIKFRPTRFHRALKSILKIIGN